MNIVTRGEERRGAHTDEVWEPLGKLEADGRIALRSVLVK
jgi:hypothetical protein